MNDVSPQAPQSPPAPQGSSWIAKPELPDDDLPSYTRFADILRSWFWSLYDHLGHWVLYNLFWFFGLWLLLGVGKSCPSVWWPLFLLLACAYSLGWAYLTFQIVVTRSGSLKDIGPGFKRYAFKGIVLCLLSFFLVGLVALNLSFYLRWQGNLRVLGWILTGVTVWLLLFWLGASLYQWPLLFFQNPPLKKILYRSFLLFLDNSWMMLLSMALGGLFAFLFTVAMVPWALLGPVFFFSFQCVALEKHLLRYKITYGDQPVADVLGRIRKERSRSWREFFKPWEAK